MISNKYINKIIVVIFVNMQIDIIFMNRILFFTLKILINIKLFLNSKIQIKHYFLNVLINLN
jgi:hypothetical protein